ncbi:MAG: Rrf2 family transcriptional regulator [Dehalococcoidia bacterium]
MEISLGRKGDYAVRAVLVLARAYGDGRRKSRQIAAVMDIPERYLPQIMAPLVRAGIARATAGPDGGYELTRSPREVTLLEVVEAAEGPITGDRCLLQGGPCDWEHICPVHHAWARAHDGLAKELRRTTFEQLAKNDALLERGAFPVPEHPLHPIPVERNGRREATRS